jgi:calcineurin-like phosphoesterase family protein
MSIFFTSDTHFGHKNIIKYSNRPYKDVTEMNEALITNWNKVVGPNDTVWHLGDFAFVKLYEFKKILNQLNGDIHCILGNHDGLIEDNRRDLLNHGKILSIQHYAELKHNGKLFCLFHYGQRTWNRIHHGAIHLYGHSHGTLEPYQRSVDVGIDCMEITAEYRPVHIDEVIKYMENIPYHSFNDRQAD